MGLMSRIGLRQLVVLLALACLLMAAGSMFWASSSLYQQALQEHDLKRQHNFARQLADKLQQRLQQDREADLLTGLIMDEQQQAWIINAGGKVLYPAGASLSQRQERALGMQHGGRAVLVTDGQGIEQMTSVVAIPQTDWQLMLQMPANGHSRVQPAFSDLLIYLLPAGVLLVLLAWLAGGRLARPFKLLASYARNLNRQESLAAIKAMEPASREASELKEGLLQGMEQLQPRPPAVRPENDRLDPVTGLSTPDILPELVTNISLGGMGFAAVVLAVDDYEQVQEHFSQEQRDQALKYLAELLLKYSRELDISVRLDEEVFLLLLPQCPLVIAQRIAERLRSKVQDSFFEGLGHMTISLGVADYQPGKKADALETLKEAQQLLIAARREGQNRVRVANGG